MTRDKRRLRRRENLYLHALDLLFFPWLLVLLAVPVLYLYPWLNVVWRHPADDEPLQVQARGLLPDERRYFTLELLEPFQGRVQILVNGLVSARFDSTATVHIVASPGELLEIDARTELRPVRVRIVASSAEHPAIGEEYELHQQIRVFIVR